jgi:hypothetical protein
MRLLDHGVQQRDVGFFGEADPVGMPPPPTGEHWPALRAGDVPSRKPLIIVSTGTQGAGTLNGPELGTPQAVSK